MNEIWLFVEHGKEKIWTRAEVPVGVTTVRALITYLQRGGRVQSSWMEIPERARFVPRALGLTVVATLVEEVTRG